jgi:hypothetical protein
MTVSQLIAQLQKLPPDFEVITSDDLEDGFNFIAGKAVVVKVVEEDELEMNTNGTLVAIIP